MQRQKGFLQNSLLFLLAVLIGISPINKNLYGQPGFEVQDFDFFSFDSFTSFNDVWSSLSEKFSLSSNADQSNVQKDISWFSKNQDYITELTRNAKPYIYYVMQETTKRGIPAELALIPMIESNYNPSELNNIGASGLWQMMPNTASDFHLKINHMVDNRQNIINSTNAALEHLVYLHQLFKDWLLAIAAYNSGEGTVQKAIHFNIKHHKPTDFWALPLPKETKAYVPRLLALASIIKDPDRYNLKLEQVPNKPQIATVTVDNQKVNLKAVAKVAQLDVKQIQKLNPALHQSVTPSKGAYTIIVPVEKAADVQKKLPQVVLASADMKPAINGKKLKSSDGKKTSGKKGKRKGGKKFSKKDTVEA